MGETKRFGSIFTIVCTPQFGNEDEFDDNKKGGKYNGDPEDDEPDDSESNYLSSEQSSEEDLEEKNKKKKSPNNERWEYDVQFLNKPKDYDGTNLEYFQAWYSMFRVEMVTDLNKWGPIFDVLEEHGEKRVHNDAIKIVIENKQARGGKKSIVDVSGEFSRIFTGVTAGEVQVSILKS